MTVERINVVECNIVTKVLVLVLAILFGQSIGIGIDSTFHKYS